MLCTLRSTAGYDKNMLHESHLKEHTSDTPHVHFVSVVAISEQAFWSPVPSGGDVLCVGLLGVDPSAAAKVC